MALKDFPSRSPEYFFVSCDRNDTTIALHDGRTYIPDIIVKGRSSGRQAPFIAYLEYERDTHTQENFEEKMERALQTLWQEDCVKCIYIVTNNHGNAMDLSKKADKWVKKRGLIYLMQIRLRKGELPMYSVETSHEAIIGPAIFEAAQVEMARSAEEYAHAESITAGK